MVVPNYKEDVQKLKKILHLIGEKLEHPWETCSISFKFDTPLYNYEMAVKDIDKAELITTPFLDILDYCVGYLYYHVLNFCGCGQSYRMLDYLTDIFECTECVVEGSDSLMFSHDKYLEKFPDIYDKWLYYEFTLKWMDSIGWSEHGTSVYSSWLTNEGKTWRDLLLLRRKYEELEGET